MRRDLRALADERFDLCVVGGGINGLATAHDAAARGMRVALVEKGDFGAETSAGSLKILHGGLRYLQHLDFSRMTESIRERNALIRLAPHLVDPLGFLVPTTPGLMTGKLAMRTALAVNDVVGWKRNRGIRDRDQFLPPGQILSRREVSEHAPGLPMKNVTGAALFYDAHMRNSDRFTLSFALSASRNGAVLANRVKAETFQVSKGRIEALQVVDEEGGERLEVRAEQFVVMTGPWRDLLPGMLPERSTDGEVVKNAGIQIVTKRGVCDAYGLAIPSGEEDPEAKLSRGARHYFSTPWQEHMLWGTTDKEYKGKPEDWRITAADIEAFVAEINAGLPGFNLKPEEVQFAFGGLRMMNPESGTGGGKVSRRYAITDHAQDFGISNLVSMDGIKYTACRIMAEKAVDRVAEKHGGSWGACTTSETVLAGAEFETRKTLEAEIRVAVPSDWSDRTVTLMAESYGSDWPRVWSEGREEGVLPDGVTPVCLVDHAMENEMALHLVDVMMRRIPLGTLGRPDEAVTQAVADRMAEALQWTDEQMRTERDRLNQRYDFA